MLAPRDESGSPGSAAHTALTSARATALPDESDPSITLPWLVRLRWVAVLGQALAVICACWVFELGFSPGLLVSLVGLAAATNLALALAAQRRERWSAASLMGSAMAFDTLLLTALLAASGGPMNPFTVFYLVHIVLAAVVLSAHWTLVIAVLSFAGFGSLFLLPGNVHVLHGEPSGMSSHLGGMWVAFVLAAVSTTFFVRRISFAIGAQREQITLLRESAARNARLAAITTLAAGAAHELGTPLGTIAIAAHEAQLALRRSSDTAAVAEDLELIALEVDRCQEILGLLAARASSPSEETRPISVSELVEAIRGHLGLALASRVDFRLGPAATEVGLPPGQTSQSVVALVRNALDASPPGTAVVVDVSSHAGHTVIEVADQGSGIPASLLARVGEPFFTTKQPGRGLGLGVFLVRAFVESRGGDFRLESQAGVGTRAIMRIPSVSSPMGAV